MYITYVQVGPNFGFDEVKLLLKNPRGYRIVFITVWDNETVASLI